MTEKNSAAELDAIDVKIEKFYEIAGEEIAGAALTATAGSLLPNAVGNDSVEFYRLALEANGIDPESLSFAEAVEVTRKLYALSADFRRDRAEARKAEREAARAEAKAKRDAERAKRAEEEIKKIEARLAALRNG